MLQLSQDTQRASTQAPPHIKRSDLLALLTKAASPNSMSAVQESKVNAAIPGVHFLGNEQVRLQRRVTMVLTVLPFLGFLAAIATSWDQGSGWIDIAIFLAMYFFTGLGVTIGFHRMLTHGSFKANPILKGVLAAAGSMAVQGSVISWVAAHRRHHAFSDQEGDPHSPHLEGGGIKGVLKGLWHAHMGWLFDPETTNTDRWAPDLIKDPLILRIDKLFPWLTVITFGFPGLFGYLISGTLYGAITAFLWGGLARIFFLHHITWSVNSICHFYGKRPFQSRDHSTNNWPLSIVSFGESWHNNHHAFPTSARHGIGQGQIDISAVVISVFEKLGWVRDVKKVSDRQLHIKKSE